jgi:nitroreductase
VTVDLYEGIMTTRAIRRFTDEPVTDEEITACLRAAAQAPSGGNIQPWQMLVVTDAELRAAVGAIYEKSYVRYRPALLASLPPFRSAEDEATFHRGEAASLHLAAHLGEAPALVLFLLPAFDLTLHDADGPLDIGTPFASIYPAVQNFCLAARSFGIGTTLTTVYRIHQDELRELLAIPDRYEVVALVPMGRPVGRFGVAARRPVERSTHWDRFGNKREPSSP